MLAPVKSFSNFKKIKTISLLIIGVLFSLGCSINARIYSLIQSESTDNPSPSQISAPTSPVPDPQPETSIPITPIQSGSEVIILPNSKYKFDFVSSSPPYTWQNTGNGGIDTNGVYSATSTGGYTSSVKMTDSNNIEYTANVKVLNIPSYSLCDSGETFMTIFSPFGILYDPGGKDSDYGNNQTCLADIIWSPNFDLNFTVSSVSMGDSNDYFYADDYAGPNYVDGYETTGGSSSMTGGSLETYFDSDANLIGSGFIATWLPQLSTTPSFFSAPDNIIFDNDQKEISVINGTGPYSFEIIAGTGTLTTPTDPSVSNQQTKILSPSSLGTVTIKATDILGASTTYDVNVLKSSSILPSVLNCPQTSTVANQTNITISGAQLVAYKYKITTGAEQCNLSQGYSQEFSVTDPLMINTSIYSFSDPTWKLCIVAKDNNNGWNKFSAATICTWTRSFTNSSKLSFSTEGQTLTEANGPISITITSKYPVKKDTHIIYKVFSNTHPAQHDLIDGVATINANQDSTTINFNQFQNVILSGEKKIIVTLTDHDNPDTQLDGLIQHQIVIVDDDSTPLTVTKVAAGHKSSCAIMSDTSLKCWGNNRMGQLGTGNTIDSYSPITIIATGVLDVKISQAHGSGGISSYFRDYACAKLVGGELKCWGNNGFGQLGTGNTTSFTAPVQIFASGVDKFDLGWATTCVVLSTGELKCWGDGQYGHIGDGNTLDRHSPTTIIASNVTDISVGIMHSCAIKTGGELWCWGRNSHSQLGDGTTTQRTTPTLIVSSGVSKVRSFNLSNCFILSLNNEAKCNGHLYTNDITSSAIPVSIISSDVADIFGGNTCFLLQNKTVKCKKVNHFEGFSNYHGYGSSTLSDIPMNDFIQLSGNTYHLCGVKTNGNMRCWGNNDWGQLGYAPSRVHSPTLTPIANYEKILFDLNGTACGLNSAGSLDCWGSGSLGPDYPNASLFVPHKTTAPSKHPINIFNSNVIDFALTKGAACVVLTGGELKCWGLSTTISGPPYYYWTYPKTVISANVQKVTMSRYVTCAIMTTGELKCWGESYIGDGNAAPPNRNPTTIFSDNVTAVSLGDSRACAIKTGGELWCWGHYPGNGSTTPVTTPVQIFSSNVKKVSVSSGATCVILDPSNELRCWGHNQFGPVGDGSVSNRYTPVSVIASNVEDVGTAEDWHTCAKLSDNTMKCWGTSSNGGVGNGIWTEYVLSPFTIPVFNNISKIFISGGSSCAKLSTNEIHCWGNNTENAFQTNNYNLIFNYIENLSY